MAIVVADSLNDAFLANVLVKRGDKHWYVIGPFSVDELERLRDSINAYLEQRADNDFYREDDQGNSWHDDPGLW